MTTRRALVLVAGVVTEIAAGDALSATSLTLAGALSGITDLTTTGNTILGDASTDTLNVGNGGLIKDASGNVGIGVVPKAWHSVYKALEITGVSLWGAGTSMFLGTNLYFDAVGFKRKATAATAVYEQVNDVHLWYSDASGAAGGAPTMTERMRIDGSGNVGVGVTATLGRIHTSGAATEGITAQSTSNNGQGFRSKSTLGDFSFGTGVGAAVNAWMVYDQAAGAERMRIDASGNVGIGTTTPGTNRVLVNKAGGVNTTILGWTDSANNTGKLSILPNGVGIGADGFLAFSTNQAGTDTFNERMRIDASGNVFVGTSTSGWGAAGRGTIEINGSGGALLGFKVADAIKANIYHDGTSWTMNNQINGPLAFYTNNAERLRIAAAGNVGINTGGTIQASGLEIVAASNTLILRQPAASGYAGLRIYNEQNSSVRALEIDYMGSTYSGGEAGNISVTGPYPLILSTSNIERMRISGAGDVVAINYLQGNKICSSFNNSTGSQGQAGDIITRRSTNSGVVYYGDSASTYLYHDGTNWSLQAASTGNLTVKGTVNGVSDRRLKTDIEPLQDALDKLTRLTGVSFKRIDSGERGIGLIAQDVQALFPELVSESGDASGDDKLLSVAYGNFAAVLIEAVKELHGRVRILETVH